MIATAPRVPSSVGEQPRAPLALLAICVLAVVGGLFSWTLDGYFVSDDFAYVAKFSTFPWSQWPRLLAESWATGLWDPGWQSTHCELRPFAALAYLVDTRLWGVNPVGFRLTNLLLHSVAAILAGLIAWRAGGRRRFPAVVAAVLFAAHPVAASVTAWIGARVDLLVTGFYLGAFLAFLSVREAPRPRPILFVALAGCFAAALFSKESALTFPGLILLADVLWLRQWRRWREPAVWAPYAVCGAVLVIYIFCRLHALAAGHVEGVGFGDHALTSLPPWSEILSRQLRYGAHLLPPARLWLADWRHAGWRLDAGHVARAVLLLAGAVGLVLAVWRVFTAPAGRAAGSAILFFSAGWWLVLTGPLVVTHYSPLHLGPMAAGGAIAIALALPVLGVTARHRAFAFGVLVVLLAYESVQTLRPWHRAALLSGEIVRAVDELPSAGGLLILDAPADLDDALCWHFAVPYAVRPPFVRTARDPDQILAGGPGVLAFGSMGGQPALKRLAAAEETAWLVRVTPAPGARVETLAVPAARLHAAAELSLAARPGWRPGQWREFVRQLAPPAPR